jgi:hypothetical protein
VYNLVTSKKKKRKVADFFLSKIESCGTNQWFDLNPVNARGIGTGLINPQIKVGGQNIN